MSCRPHPPLRHPRESGDPDAVLMKMGNHKDWIPADQGDDEGEGGDDKRVANPI